jgi:hypothetical protein
MRERVLVLYAYTLTTTSKMTGEYSKGGEKRTN